MHCSSYSPTFIFSLFSRYRQKKFWWELIVLLRKYLLILLSTVVRSEMYKLHLGIGVMVFAMHLHDSGRPYGGSAHHHMHRNHHHHRLSKEEKIELQRRAKEGRMLHLLENWSLILLLFLLWCGFLFMLNVCNFVDRGWCIGLIVVVLGSNLLYLLSTAGRCCKAFFKRNEKNVKGLVRGVKGLAGKISGKRKGVTGEESGKKGGASGEGTLDLELPPAISIKVQEVSEGDNGESQLIL